MCGCWSGHLDGCPLDERDDNDYDEDDDDDDDDGVDRRLK